MFAAGLSAVVMGAFVCGCKEKASTVVVAANSVPHNTFVMFDAAVNPGEVKIIWEWNPAHDAVITNEPDRVKWFHAPDECKVIDGGKTLLVCASGCGFAEIDIPSRQVHAFGNVHGDGPYGNPHSIEKLPDGRYAFASSDGPGGNSITLIDVKGAELEPAKQKRVRAAFCYLAHGVEWDAERQSLWALGKTNIAEYAYNSEAMTLTEKRSFPLPTSPDCYGHDLYWAMNGKLLITTPEMKNPDGKGYKAQRVYEFDRETGSVTLSDVSDEELKSISYNPAGDVVMMATDRGTCKYGWQSNYIRFGKAGEKAVKKGPYKWAAFYKARFVDSYQR